MRVLEVARLFSNYIAHIDAFLDNEVLRGMMVIGRRGMGKSYNLLQRLDERGVKYCLLKGHHTPLSFYRMLYEHRKGCVLVLDDTVNVLKDREIQGLLLAALDYDNRFVYWNSTSPLMDGLPESFEFNSKIVMLCNEVPRDDSVFSALMDRCLVYRLELSRDEILEAIDAIVRAKGYPIEIAEFIRENADSLELSLRLPDKIYSYYGRENWRALVMEVVRVDPVVAVVVRLSRSSLPVKEQVRRFVEETGLSRRTFFRIKRRLSNG
jgi:hypothetical protein